MKTRVLLVAALLCVTIPLAAMPAIAAENEAVQCTVAVAETIISVSVTTSTVDFGTLPLSTDSSESIGYSPIFEVSNSGTVREDILVSGTDAHRDPEGTWVLSDNNVAADQFFVGYTAGLGAFGSAISYDPRPASIKLTGCDPGTVDPMELQINMPTSTAFEGAYVFDVYYTAMASSP